MANDWNADDPAKAAPTDGWVEDADHEELVREAPDAPLVPTRADAPVPRADDELWTTKNDAPKSASGLSLPVAPGAPVPKRKPEPLSDIDSGKAMAILAHCSFVLGLPVFLVPLLQRDNAFSLHHAKAAGANYLIFLALFALAFATCGLSVPLIFLCYIPALVGIVDAANGNPASSWALGALGERIFKAQVKPNDETSGKG